MKKIVLLLVAMTAFNATAQQNTELTKHFEAYFQQMKKQGDTQGVINAMTHLEVLQPSQARRDTIAFFYASKGRHMEALNLIGIDKNATDSDLNVEVKAIALKAVNQTELALGHFEVLFERQPSAYMAYEIADLKVQTGDFAAAKAKIEYGLANVKEDMKRSFYETQQPYQTSLKAAFLYLKALVLFNEDQEANLDSALSSLDQALAIDPNFNMAKISKNALSARTKKE